MRNGVLGVVMAVIVVFISPMDSPQDMKINFIMALLIYITLVQSSNKSKGIS